MPGQGFDYAVHGSSPFAGLLAGLLATAHGKRVAVVGEPWSSYRLPRRFDLSVTPATRPETWALLKRDTAEILKLLGGIGRGLHERVDPLFVAETGVSADRLGHMRWVAAGFGFAAERAVDRTITENGTICRIRDAVLLVNGKIEPAIEAWLAKNGVRRSISAVDAETVVLADDDAILDRLPAAGHRLFAPVSGLSIVTAAARPIGSAFIHYLDRGVALHQHGGKGPVVASSMGDPATAVQRIGASLAHAGRLKRTGQAIFRAVETLDGAPLIAPLGNAMVITGLDASAAFFAPALARWLVGKASEEEQRYFDARGVAQRAIVAEAAAPLREMAS